METENHLILSSHSYRGTFFFNCAVSLLFLIFIILQFILKGDNIGNLFQFTCRNIRFVKLGNLIERRNIIIF